MLNSRPENQPYCRFSARSDCPAASALHMDYAKQKLLDSPTELRLTHACDALVGGPSKTRIYSSKVQKQLFKGITGMDIHGQPRWEIQSVSTTRLILIVSFNAGYATSSKLVSEIGSRLDPISETSFDDVAYPSRGRLSGSPARVEGSDCIIRGEFIEIPCCRKKEREYWEMLDLL